MLIVRLVVFLLLLVLLAYLIASNAGQAVDLRFFGREYLAVDLFWIVAGSFIAGVFCAGIALLTREWRHHREVGKLRRQLATVQREIGDLRTLPLQDLTGDGQAKDD